MNTSFRFLSIALLSAAVALPGCSREEEAPAPAAPAARPAGAPAAAPPGQAAAPAEGEPADIDPNRARQNLNPEEPGFLTAFADSDETIGDAPLTVKLNVDVIENTGTPPYTFAWDFGDATEFSSEKSPTHTYKIPGNFRASVIIRDSKGEVDQDYIDIAVSDPNAPSGITAEQLMQQVPLEEILRQAREAGAKAAKEGQPAGQPADRDAAE